MILSQKLADEIVQRAMSIIHHNVNVIDKNGVIISSGDHRRIGKIHDVGREVATRKERICVYDKNDGDVSLGKSVVSGINHPIIVDNDIQFVVGVTGNPNEISRYAELAFITAELLAKQAIENEHINWTTRIKDLEFVSLLNNKDLVHKISLDKHEDLESSYSLPKYPLIIKIMVDDNYQQLMGDIIRSITHTLSYENFGIIEQSIFFALAKDKSKLDKIIEDISNIAKKIDGRISFCKSFCAIDLESLISSIRFGIFSLKYKSDLENNIIDITSKNIISYMLHGEPCKEYFDYLIYELLKNSKGEELLNTIKCYLKNNLEIKNTTNELGIHRNTLQNRFKLIKEMTNLDLNNFENLQIISLALDHFDSVRSIKYIEPSITNSDNLKTNK